RKVLTGMFYPKRNIVNYLFHNMTRHIVISRDCFTATFHRHKQVKESGVAFELHIIASAQRILPVLEILHGNLVIGFRLENQHLLPRAWLLFILVHREELPYASTSEYYCRKQVHTHHRGVRYFCGRDHLAPLRWIYRGAPPERHYRSKQIYDC